MLTLFTKTGCPYCAMVIHKLEDLGLSWEEKNIANDEVASELISLGGKRQVPYFIDHDRDTKMYESGDIVDYLERTFGGKKQG
jgi:glutathione S-transferase